MRSSTVQAGLGVCPAAALLISMPTHTSLPPLLPQSSFLSQPPAFVPSYLRHAPYMKQQQQQPVHMVPLGGAPGVPATHHMAAVPQAGPGPMSAADAEAEAARVQRHRERQRKKRAFGRAVRYQSRRAYAEIRPRIKGRFVTPEVSLTEECRATSVWEAAGQIAALGCIKTRSVWSAAHAAHS
jgi:hypothetical protein